jgi:hypothetical protein
MLTVCLGGMYPILLSLSILLTSLVHQTIVGQNTATALTETHGHYLIDTSVPLIFPLGPINREMRHLISSLQNHNHQLKGDVQRYKRKLRETQMEINKVGS